MNQVVFHYQSVFSDDAGVLKSKGDIMEVDGDSSQSKEIKNLFNKELNSHGYSLQYAIIQAAKEASLAKESSWIFEAAEFPVEANGKHTRIDFILKSPDKDSKYLLVAECKRVNPAYGHWCFIKAPFVSRNRTNDRYSLELLSRQKYEEPLNVYTLLETICHRQFYHIGLSVKSQSAKGNSGGNSDHDAIERTATQLCLGVNGLIQLVASVKDMAMFHKAFIPVIFTTATLWASEGKISKASLQDGNIDISSDDFEQKKWLLLQYNLTPGIKHSIATSQSSKDLSAFMDFSYIRTIAVVNSKHTKEFLGWLRPFDFFE